MSAVPNATNRTHWWARSDGSTTLHALPSEAVNRNDSAFEAFMGSGVTATVMCGQEGTWAWCATTWNVPWCDDCLERLYPPKATSDEK